jgi:16S rRNA (adenine(1408)-N(1))-methyltransferase
MAETSRRAARSGKRGGVPNALFVVASAEQPPAELRAIADLVTIQFPWGSLLRGALALDDDASAGIASLLRLGGELRVTTSVVDRDGAGLPRLDDASAAEELSARWQTQGLCLDAFRLATEDEIRATGSTWARRLRAGNDRPAWRFSLRADGWGDGRSDPR